MLAHFKSLSNATSAWCNADPVLRAHYNSIPALKEAWIKSLNGYTKAAPPANLMQGITRRQGTRPAWIYNGQPFEDREFNRGGKATVEQAAQAALRAAIEDRDGSAPDKATFQQVWEEDVLPYTQLPKRRRIDSPEQRAAKRERERQRKLQAEAPPEEWAEENELSSGPYGEYGSEEYDPYANRTNLRELSVSQVPLPTEREARVAEMARRAERGEQVITADDRLTRPAQDPNVLHQQVPEGESTYRGHRSSASTRGAETTGDASYSRSSPSFQSGGEDKAYFPSQPMPPALPPKSLFGPLGRKYLAQHGPDDRLSRSKAMNKSLPYGLQVLKRLWDDNSALIHEYDEFAENSDNQAVKFYCSSECAQKRKNLDELTRVWHAHPMSKAFQRPEGMGFPEPDEYDVEDADQRHQRALGAGEFGSDDYFNELTRDEEGDEDWTETNPAYMDEEGQMGGQDFMRGLGSQMGPDQKIPMGQEQFHKALLATADFLKALTDMSSQPPMSHEEVAATDIGYGNEDQELASPLARKQKRYFSKGLQSESRRQANELDQFKPNDRDVQAELDEVMRLLRGLADSREGAGSEEPLSAAEVDSIDKKEKSLRSLLSGRKGRWPKGDWGRVNKKGSKGMQLNVIHKEMGITHPHLAAIASSQAEQARGIAELDETLQRLSRMLS